MSAACSVPGGQASFADLGLPAPLRDGAAPELATTTGTVGELVAFDERSSAELIATLDAYFEANGSPTRRHNV